MKSRTLQPQPSSELNPERPPFGLRTATPSRSAVPLPLKTLDARFEIIGDCAQVAMEQIFEFDGPNPADVIYTFPLPGDASVHRCEMRVGGRLVAAKAKPLDQARADFQKAHDAGHRAALVESVRDNLFELQLGNLQPGDEVTIRISYILPLEGVGLQRRLRIPTCPGIRYIPGEPVGGDGGTDIVPDAGRLNPRRHRPEDPQAAVFFCAGTLVGATEIESTSHDVTISPPTADGKVAVMLNMDSDVPDRDFLLLWKATGAPLAMIAAQDPQYMVCSVMAPDDMPPPPGGRDIFFLLDASGSMNGGNWTALVAAVELALGELSPKDSVSVSLFANGPEAVTQGLVRPDVANVAAILSRLRRHHPDGGTEFSYAFEITIEQAERARRPVIVVITDGQFGDEKRTCALAVSHGIEVHTIGIDANVNEAVLQKIARRTRGTCSLCAPYEELEQTIHQLVRNLLSPALDHLGAGPEWQAIGNPPALRAGQSALVPFKRVLVSPSAESPAVIDLKMRFSDGSVRNTHLPVCRAGDAAPALVAAKADVRALMDDGRSAEAVRTACLYNLLCDGTAFVAIDEASKVPVATAIVDQPSPVPHEIMPRLKSKCVSYSADPGMHAFIMQESVMPSVQFKKDISCDCSFPGDFEEIDAIPAGLHSREVLRCIDLAQRVTCFDADRWHELFENHLLPWARRRPMHLRLLERLLNDLAQLADHPDHPHARLLALDALRELAVFLDQEQEAAEAIRWFVHD